MTKAEIPEHDFSYFSVSLGDVWFLFGHHFGIDFSKVFKISYFLVSSRSWQYLRVLWTLKADYRQRTADSLLTQTATKQIADSWTINLNGKQTCRPSDRKLVTSDDRLLSIFTAGCPWQAGAGGFATTLFGCRGHSFTRRNKWEAIGHKFEHFSNGSDALCLHVAAALQR